jgi:hypothetical protein
MWIMKVLKIDMERFYSGFKIADIKDPYAYASGFKEKYVNNSYLEHSKNNYSEFDGITELQRIQFLLSGLEINAKLIEIKNNPYISINPKFLLEDFESFKKGENIEDEILFAVYFIFYEKDKELFDSNKLISKLKAEVNIDFAMFFIALLNSLHVYNVDEGQNLNSIPFFVGIMDRITSTVYKNENLNLTFRQKYIIISQLVYLFLKKIKIRNKDLVEAVLHYIIWALIDKTEHEFDYLHKIGEDGGYIPFLNSKLFRSPMSAKALQDMFCSIEHLFQEKDAVDEIAEREVFRQVMAIEQQHTEKENRKEWKKQDFIRALQNHKNQSEMAKAYGISRQRISELKKKFNIT